MAKFSYKQSSEDSNIYNFFDDDQKAQGLFRLIPVVPPKPDYCKHMELFIFQEVVDDILRDNDFKRLVQIYRFVFDSVLEITHNLQGAKLCKLYAQEHLGLAYREFANALKKDKYEVKFYRNWIEITKKQ